MALHEALNKGETQAFYDNMRTLEGVNDTDKVGETLLHIACRKKMEPIVRILLRHPAIDPNQADHDNNTPLYHVVVEKEVNLVRLLLEHPSTSVTTELVHPARLDYEVVLKYLLTSDTEIPPNYINTAIQTADKLHHDYAKNLLFEFLENQQEVSDRCKQELRLQRKQLLSLVQYNTFLEDVSAVLENVKSQMKSTHEEEIRRKSHEYEKKITNWRSNYEDLTRIHEETIERLSKVNHDERNRYKEEAQEAKQELESAKKVARRAKEDQEEAKRKQIYAEEDMKASEKKARRAEEDKEEAEKKLRQAEQVIQTLKQQLEENSKTNPSFMELVTELKTLKNLKQMLQTECHELKKENLDLKE